jgi:hypothetical protein
MVPVMAAKFIERVLERLNKYNRRVVAGQPSARATTTDHGTVLASASGTTAVY